MKNEYLRVFKALSDEKRVQILEKLCQGEQCACELLKGLEISQSTLSHHMKILCESGLVKGERDGAWMYYSINGEGCSHANHLIHSITGRDMKRWLSVFAVIGRLVEPFKPILCPVSCDPKYICYDPNYRKAVHKC